MRQSNGCVFTERGMACGQPVQWQHITSGKMFCGRHYARLSAVTRIRDWQQLKRKQAEKHIEVDALA